MKTAKLTIGILSIITFLLMSLQSCAAIVSIAFQGNSADQSGSIGIVVAFCYLIAGIIAVAGSKSRGASVAAVIFYLLGALFGLASSGIYTDLSIWSGLAAIFGVLFIIFAIVQRRKPTEFKG